NQTGKWNGEEDRRGGDRRRSAEAFHDLVELGVELASERDPKQLAKSVIEAAMRFTGATEGSLFQRSLNDHLHLTALIPNGSTIEDQEGIDIHAKSSENFPICLTALKGHSVNIEDISACEDFDLSDLKLRHSKNGESLDNLLTIPLRDSSGHIVAVLELLNAPTENGFEEEGQHLVELLASQAGTYFENLDLYERVIASGISLTSERDPHALFERIVLEAKRLTNADCGAMLVRLNDKHLHYRILHNDPDELSLGGTSGLDIGLDPIPLHGADGGGNAKSISAISALKQTMLNINDTSTEDRFDATIEGWLDKDDRTQTKSLLATPLVGRNGATLGVILLRNARDRGTKNFIGFDDHTKALIKALAAQAAVALDNQEVYQQLIETGISLSAERNHAQLMERILLEAKEICNAEGGTLYLRTEEDGLAFTTVHNDVLGIAMGGTTGKDIAFPPLQMYDPETGEPNHKNVSTHVALTGETVNVEDAYEVEGFDFAGAKKFDEANGYRSKSFLTVPLKDRDDQVIGVLQLINARDWETGKVEPFSHITQPLVESLTSQAAVALNNQQLMEAQKKLLDSFIELIAGAIDAKSPYTGGHCQRVPELAKMLVEEACNSNEPPFAEFDLDEDGRYELHIASWLHDCGKVTTPEYVVDKATKLETIYNRVHEVRMRFEVVKREAEIACLNKIIAGEGDADTLRAELAEELAQIDEEFNFIANANVGGEFMADEDIDRIKEIANRTWTRTLDDWAGISQDEELVRVGHEKIPAPTIENLLADKPYHVTPRPEYEKIPEDNPYGIKMPEPDNRFNFGEIYNLSIRRGTLTEEERYKINQHIVQTIIMLKELPWPRHLRKVPEYAGGHHEKMDGTGYPCKLNAEDMSLPARVMAIADIFEALTASDRPYKKAKTLSEAVKILSFMNKDGHLDQNLFELFLTSGVYKEYGDRFLLPEQIDKVDISQYIKAAE
ncbi:MAG: GAF domain-containing protein, partial [Rhodospirillales bacterium]|nr:GAF domain-containing protein [Rhodospirillales bacterium]